MSDSTRTSELGGFDRAAARGRRRASRGTTRSQDQLGYRAALQIAHGILNPRSYVEIGCQHGASLAIARCPSIAIDPEFEITQQLSAPTRIFRQTSEQFFKTCNLRSLVGGPFDLAFIDGLHHAEAALLDFMNLEINSGPNSVIVIDDVLPADMTWTTRERHTKQWTGDVYRVPLILRALRPDLSVELFDIADKGMAIVSRLDRNSKVLPRQFDELCRAIVDGEYRLDSVDAIRTTLAPRPVPQLVNHLLEVVAARVLPYGEWIGSPAAARKRAAHAAAAASDYVAERARGRELYLSTMVRILANTVYQDANTNPRRPPEYDAALRAVGRDWPAQAFTMIGVERLDNLRRLAACAIEDRIAGDFIETGVWRGGACILMRAVLAAYGDETRRVVCADSFGGLPPPNPHQYPADAGDKHHKYPQLTIARAEVEEAFQRFDLLDDQVEFVEGLFQDTLAGLRGRSFALLRLDGDMYESTFVALDNLYPCLSPGGFIIIDDYGAIPACRTAAEDYRSAHGIMEPLQAIDWTGVWWRKGCPQNDAKIIAQS